MTDHPMIFSAEMIRALLDGRKTQTRKLLKPRPQSVAEKIDAAMKWRIGDRIWVKETCAVWQSKHTDIVYRAYATDKEWDGLKHDANDGAPWAVYSPMFTPKRFSRLTLTVTNVRVQRVQDITEADARAEGADPVLPDPNEMGLAGDGSYRDGFRDLWNNIHGPDAWDRNDWIVALTFDVHKRNIMEMDG